MFLNSYLTEKDFLNSAKAPTKTDSLFAPSHGKFIRQVESQFINTVVRRQRGLTDVEFENQKSLYLDSADVKQIILCANPIKNGEQVVLVTEETESSNDKKLFKKIPAICKELAIETMTLPELLEQYDGVEIIFQ